MNEDARDEVAAAVEVLRRRYAGFLREADATSLCAAWTVAGSWLRWQVEIEDALEPDVDVEILPEVLVVRALRGTSAGPGVAVLPVPAAFDGARPVIRVRGEVLEIRVRARTAADGAG